VSYDIKIHQRKNSMVEKSILRERIASCEQRQAYAAIFVSVGIIAQQSGNLISSAIIEYAGLVNILVGIVILVYSMYRSAIDY